MARIPAACSRWERAFDDKGCEWCGAPISRGVYRLRIGILKLVCCQFCAKTRRGLEPPVESAEERDPRMEALPVGDR